MEDRKTRIKIMKGRKQKKKKGIKDRQKIRDKIRKKGREKRKNEEAELILKEKEEKLK